MSAHSPLSDVQILMVGVNQAFAFAIAYLDRKYSFIRSNVPWEPSLVLDLDVLTKIFRYFLYNKFDTLYMPSL